MTNAESVRPWGSTDSLCAAKPLVSSRPAAVFLWVISSASQSEQASTGVLCSWKPVFLGSQGGTLTVEWAPADPESSVGTKVLPQPPSCPNAKPFPSGRGCDGCGAGLLSSALRSVLSTDGPQPSPLALKAFTPHPKHSALFQASLSLAGENPDGDIKEHSSWL